MLVCRAKSPPLLRQLLSLLALLLLLALAGCSFGRSEEEVPGAQAADVGIAGSRPAAGAGDQGEFRMEARLSGQEVVPPVRTEADGSFRLEAKSGEAKFALEVAGVEAMREVHIHSGPAGANGPLLTRLLGEGVEPKGSGSPLTGSIGVDQLEGALAGLAVEDLLATLLAGPVYVEVHTSAHPDGEIRGQLELLPPEPAPEPPAKPEERAQPREREVDDREDNNRDEEDDREEDNRGKNRDENDNEGRNGGNRGPGGGGDGGNGGDGDSSGKGSGGGGNGKGGGGSSGKG